MRDAAPGEPELVCEAHVDELHVDAFLGGSHDEPGEVLLAGAGELDLDPHGGVVDGLGAVDGADAERLVFGRLGVRGRRPCVLAHDGIMTDPADADCLTSGGGVSSPCQDGAWIT